MSNSSMLRKTAALTVACSMAFTALLTGCGKSEQKASAGSNAATAASSDIKELKPCELSWYTIGDPQKDTDKVLEEASKYTREKINASVKMTIFDWAKYEEKMKIMIQSGEKFDMCFTCSWALPYEQMVEKNAFLPLDDLLDKYGQGIKEELSPLFIDGNRIKGKLYAIANNKEFTPETRWLFNKDLLDKYKLDVTNVKSLQSLEPLLKVIKENEKDIVDIYGADCGFYDQSENILGDNIPFVVPFNSKDLKIVNRFDIPKVREDLKTLNKYYKAGYIRSDIGSFAGFDRNKSDKWFVRIDGWLPGMDESSSNPGRAKVISVPVFDRTYVSNYHVSGSMIAISATSENPERSMMFLNLLNTDKYLRNLVNYGIENVHYTLENGKLKKTQAGSSNYDTQTFTLGNVFLTYPLTTDPDNIWDMYKKFNDGMEKSPIFGFKADLSSMKKEISAFSNIWSEFGKIMTCGVIDIDEVYPKYMKKMKDAGYDKVMQDLQTQLDAWKASKGK